MSYLQRLQDAQNRDLHEARSYIDRAESEGRELSVEERTAWDALGKQMDDRAAHMASVREDEQRTASIEAALASAPEVRAVPATRSAIADDNEVIRQIARGEIRSHSFGPSERRDLNTTDDSSIVPQSFYGQMAELLTTVGPMVDGNVVTIVRTAGGEDMKWPVEATRPAATAIAEATTIVALDPTFSSITLKSQKIALLTKVSSEVLADSGVNLIQVLTNSLGTAAGIKINGLLTLGTGTAEAHGLIPAATVGVTGGTGVSGAPTADNLIDLAHSVDGLYVRRGAGWMMRRTTIGVVRKLKDTAGNYLYVPSANVGVPDEFMSYPIHENPDVVATAVNAKSVAFGWFGSYHTRLVGGFELARSDDAYFADDEIGFRLTARIWGDLGQTTAVKVFAGGTA